MKRFHYDVVILGDGITALTTAQLLLNANISCAIIQPKSTRPPIHRALAISPSSEKILQKCAVDCSTLSHGCIQSMIVSTQKKEPLRFEHSISHPHLAQVIDHHDLWESLTQNTTIPQHRFCIEHMKHTDKKTILEDASTVIESHCVLATDLRDQPFEQPLWAHVIDHNQIALTAGYDHALGKCVISLDSDLQHPPTI